MHIPTEAENGAVGVDGIIWVTDWGEVGLRLMLVFIYYYISCVRSGHIHVSPFHAKGAAVFRLEEGSSIIIPRLLVPESLLDLEEGG